MPRATADSLLHHYGYHTTTIDLPAPVVLRAHSGRLQLCLFMTSLNCSQIGSKTQYTYSLEGELQVRPQPSGSPKSL